eukprot:g4908.t1
MSSSSIHRAAATTPSNMDLRRSATQHAKRAMFFENRGEISVSKREYAAAVDDLATLLRHSDVQKQAKAMLSKRVESFIAKIKSMGGLFRVRGDLDACAAAARLKRDFGMYFNSNGELQGFKYTNETDYERCGDLATEILHWLLKNRYGMSEIAIDVLGSSPAPPPPSLPAKIALAAKRSGEREAGLRDRPIVKPKAPIQSRVFGTKNWKTADVLLIIIHGAGAIRAGMWARKLLLNVSMESGTCLPWLDAVDTIVERSSGDDTGDGKWGVLLLSPNDNCVDSTNGRFHCNKCARPKREPPLVRGGGKRSKNRRQKPGREYVRGVADGGPPIPVPRGGRILIRGSETPQRHVLTAWQHVISQTRAFQRKQILVAAHSWGGVSTVSLLRHRVLGPSARRAIKAVAFLDSVHRHPEPKGPSRNLFVCDPDGNEQKTEGDDSSRDETTENVWTRQHRARRSERKQRRQTETDRFLATRCRSWVKSKFPVDRMVAPLSPFNEKGTVCVSAGTSDHDRCPFSARMAVFDFFRSALAHNSSPSATSAAVASSSLLNGSAFSTTAAGSKIVEPLSSSSSSFFPASVTATIPTSVVKMGDGGASRSAQWQFEDGRRGSQQWTPMIPRDAALVEAAFRDNLPKLRLTNKRGNYVITLGPDPSRFSQRSVRTSTVRRIRRVVRPTSDVAGRSKTTMPTATAAPASHAYHAVATKVTGSDADAATTIARSRSVTWQFEDGSRGSGKWKSYDPKDVAKIERAFRRKEYRCRINNQHGSYIISIGKNRNAWSQKSLRSSFKRRVRRVP